jgi:Flp pilus assembly protein TadB
MQAALLDWHLYVQSDERGELRALRNRLILGQSAHWAVAKLNGELEGDARALAAVVAVQKRCGGEAARMVESLAGAAERRVESYAKAAAYGSGAKLSARLIAALPLAFVPVTPLTRAPLTDRPGLFLLALGLGLALAGLAWISALFPEPSRHDDPAAALSEILACGVEGGADVRPTLLDVCTHPPPGLETSAGRVQRLLRLGAGWNEALAQSGDDALAELGRSLSTAVAMGLPLGPALRSFAGLRRTDDERAFETAVRRAPVRMAVPLAVCVLPAFVVLGIGPFLRGLSFGT